MGLLYTLAGLVVMKPLFCIFIVALTSVLAVLSPVLTVAGISILYVWNIFIFNTETYKS